LFSVFIRQPPTDTGYRYHHKGTAT